MKHVHAELMAQYAQDAMTTDRPWELWEYFSSDGVWRSILIESPSWNTLTKYRRKPKTIRVGNRDLPEPLRVAPVERTRYWLATAAEEETCDYYWSNDQIDNRWLRRGLLHSTREAAEQWRDAFIELAGG